MGHPAEQFAIGFDQRDRERIHAAWDEIFDTNRWSEGPFTDRFERLWSEWNGLPAAAFGSWAGGAVACLEFFGLKGKTVLCASNTFMATPLSVLQTGGDVQFVDCNRHDLCMSYDDFVAKAERFTPAAVWLVHIGGHIAFDVERISEYCRARRIILLEDCAHAHGADWNGRKPGSWGDAGVYSFYATKTVTTGEGGMVVSRHQDLIDFARKFRNYGKPDYAVAGLNYRINEFAAAIGCVQTERMADIVRWKQNYARTALDPVFANRVTFPEGMTSGYYKYVVFDRIERSTGRVYDQPCHRLLRHDVDLPNTDWVAQNHWCAPLYYHPEATVDSRVDRKELLLS